MGWRSPHTGALKGSDAHPLRQILLSLEEWTVAPEVGYVDFQGVTVAPPAPPAGTLRLYAIENAGKMELRVVAPSGDDDDLYVEP